MSSTVDNPVPVPPPCRIPPIIYAEYLPKLQKMSILVQLPTPSQWKTKVVIGKDSLTLYVFHEGITTEMLLPVPATMRDEHLGLGPKNRNEIDPGHLTLSWRVPPAPAFVQAALLATVNGQGQEALRVPWSAADLVPGVEIACRKCETVLIGKDKIREWKDLPSENWAEMMEFWHCHKPTVKKENMPVDGSANGRGGKETTDGDQLASRGYGANSTVSAQRGVGFVDLTKFLFNSEDCRGLTMTALPDEKNDKKTSVQGSMVTTSCLECSTQLGHFEFRKNGFTLYKWAVNLTDVPSDIKPLVAAPNLAQCISAALLEIQARDNSAKVVLQGDDKEAITVWVLNPHIVFSCLAVQRAKAMKVLFRNEAMPEAAGELELPDAVVLDIRSSLQRSNGFMPPAEKTANLGVKQGTWNVGLLQRL